MIRSLVGPAILDLWALLSPVSCAGCGAPDRAVCAECRERLRPRPTPRAVAGLRVWTALEYSGVARRAILAFKEEHRTDAAAALAPALAAALVRAFEGAPPGTEVALVPSSRAAWRRRGYDPVGVLARRAGLLPRAVLIARRSGPAQKALSIADRSANRAGAFVARRPLQGRTFVIVDDVLTSGATITEAGRAVRSAGGTVYSGACLAFTARLL